MLFPWQNKTATAWRKQDAWRVSWTDTWRDKCRNTWRQLTQAVVPTFVSKREAQVCKAFWGNTSEMNYHHIPWRKVILLLFNQWRPVFPWFHCLFSGENSQGIYIRDYTLFHINSSTNSRRKRKIKNKLWQKKQPVVSGAKFFSEPHSKMIQKFTGTSKKIKYFFQTVYF